MLQIWHNPRCSKSRETLALLESKGLSADIFLYLTTPFTIDELQAVITKLGIEAKAIVRTKETLYKELNVADCMDNTEELLKVLVNNPKLIERPIVITDNHARLGRPPEQVLEIL